MNTNGEVYRGSEVLYKLGRHGVYKVGLRRSLSLILSASIQGVGYPNIYW